MPRRLLPFAFTSKRSFDVRMIRKLNEIQLIQGQNAESEIIKIVQRAAFLKEVSRMKKLNVQEQTSGEKSVSYENKAIKKASSLYQLDPFLDPNGILRVGRIRHSSLSYGAKHPNILPRTGHVTELIICHHHL